MNLRKFILTCILTGVPFHISGLHAQEKMKLTIEELFQRIEEYNTEVEAARKGVRISAEEEKSARAQRYPGIDLSASADYLGNAYVLDRDFSNPTLSPMPHIGNSLSLSIYQPLYTGGELSANIEKAGYQTQLSRAGLKSVTDKMKIEALECYINLLKYRNLLNVYDENIILTEELIAEMEARSRHGFVLANDVTRYELNLSNLNYDRLTITDAIEHLNYSLTVYLGLPGETVIETELDQRKYLFTQDGTDVWQQKALEKSPELMQLELAHRQSFSEQKLLRSKMLPKIGLSAGNNLEGPITNISPVLDKNLNTMWIGLRLSFDISSYYRSKGDLNAARIRTTRLADEHRAMEESISRQIDLTYRKYIEACEQIDTQLKNVELATENYRIIERRYSADLSLLTDMLDASASKLDAEVRLVNAKANAIYYYFQLKYISGSL